jgi:hypothetical protein
MYAEDSPEALQLFAEETRALGFEQGTAEVGVYDPHNALKVPEFLGKAAHSFLCT